MATATRSKREKPAGGGSVKRDSEQLVAQKVDVQPLRCGSLTFHLTGTSPLVLHNFSEKARKQMLDKQMGTAKRTKQPPRCPVEEFLQSFYWVEGSAPKPDRVKDEIPEYDKPTVAKAIKEGVFGIPSTAFKNALISACRNTDLKMTAVRQAVFVSGLRNPNWAIIKGTPEMRADIVRIGQKKPMEVFRPVFYEWETDIVLEFDLNTMTRDQIANLVAIAGFYVGVCEGRPEKSALGWGRWTI